MRGDKAKCLQCDSWSGLGAVEFRSSCNVLNYCGLWGCENSGETSLGVFDLDLSRALFVVCVSVW